MKKNKGIAFLTLVATVTVIAIIASMVIISGSANISKANFEVFKQDINIVKESIDMRYEKTKTLPVINTSESIISGLSSSEKAAFISEISKNGDNLANIKIVDMNNIYDVLKGKGKGNISNKDIFVVSTTSNNVYYLKGYKYKGNIYFGQVEK